MAASEMRLISYQIRPEEAVGLRRQRLPPLPAAASLATARVLSAGAEGSTPQGIAWCAGTCTELLQELGRTIVQGFYKFSSKSSVDEDSDVSVPSLLDDSILKTATRCIATEKANGKCAVVTLCQILGRLHAFGGSKVRPRVAAPALTIGRAATGCYRLMWRTPRLIWMPLTWVVSLSRCCCASMHSGLP